MDRQSDSTSAEATPNGARKKWLKRAFHAVILVVTIAFVGRQIVVAQAEMRTHPVHLKVGWLAASGLGYGLGLAILGVTWHVVLTDQRAGAGFGRTLRAYLISHVGKYVPGKAMVIVIRCGLLAPAGVSVGLVTLTSFYETFASMGTGALLALGCLPWLPTLEGSQWPVSRAVLWIALSGLAGGFTLAISPVGFQWFKRIVTVPFKGAQGHADRRVSWATFGQALAIGLSGWLVIGMSFLCAIDSVVERSYGFEALPLATACVSLSIIAGFLSMIPGQAVVREAIQIALLEPLIGTAGAVAASLLFRVVTLVTEAALAGLLYLGGRR